MLGVVAGLLTLGTGGRVQYVRGTLEFYGGFSLWLARKLGFWAMTLGHIIIGRDPWCLATCREHEQAHVRQVEIWGIAFIPAYFIASLLAWRSGLHYYRDNWFERDARRACGEPNGNSPPEPMPRSCPLSNTERDPDASDGSC
jgi:hypothetical protein